MKRLTQSEIIAKKKENTATIGMLIFLGSWAMMFAACFYAYTLLRVSSGGWPPDGMPALPKTLPAINTLILLASSFSLYRALAAARSNQQQALVRWLSATPLLGFAFTGLQILLWNQMTGQGLTHQTGSYGSAFYFLTAFHALHVVVGLGMLLSTLPKAYRGVYTADSHQGLKMVAMFWHFVDLIWILMFLFVFIA